MITATVIADSLNVATNDRMTTFAVTIPKFLLAELRTHRLLHVDDSRDALCLSDALAAYDADVPSVLSVNAGSSRAVPMTTMMRRVHDDPFVPVWRKDGKMMKRGELMNVMEVSDNYDDWMTAMHDVLAVAERMRRRGTAREIVNRLLEPFAFVDALISATEWKNWFALRDHPRAQLEVEDMAHKMRLALDASTPEHLEPGKWHLPYLTNEEAHWITYSGPLFGVAMVSSARCARVSVRSFATGLPSTVDEDLALYRKLTGDTPKHLSPTEHPAQAAFEHQRYGNLVGFKSYRKVAFQLVETGGDLSNIAHVY